MAIKVERVEALGVDVTDAASAARRLSELFDVSFRGYELGGQDGVAISSSVQAPSIVEGTRVFIDREGVFELLQLAATVEDEKFRNIHFKVADVDAALAELSEHGIAPIADQMVGGLREAILDPADFYGIRLCLVEYDAPSMIEGILNGRAGEAP